MRVRSLSMLSSMLLAALVAFASLPPASAAPLTRPVVLVLVDGLSWEAVEREPGLRVAFRNGAAATLSTVQGSEPPDDPAFGYVFLGAGSRVDTRFLPEELPQDPGRVPDAFDGPAQTVHPGSLGDALERAGMTAASIGDKARLVVMDSDGDVSLGYEDGDPLTGLEAALDDGAGFVAAGAEDPAQAARIVEAARRAEAAVAVAAPSGSPQTPNLAPFVLVEPGKRGGLLYSPTTRTEGLLTNADVAPTLLALLDVPAPPEMSGRVAEVRSSGQKESAERLQRRLWFVKEGGFRVWAVVGVLWAVALAVGVLRGGRRGVSTVVLALAGLPAGALLAAAVPVAGVLPVAALIAALAGGITALSRKLSGDFSGSLAWIALVTAALVVLDAAAGGALERFSTLGYNPATGTRFYGVGNEYAAVLAGGLTMGLGILAHRRVPVALLAAVGGIPVLALGLPTMGANVGGSLALGLGFGATVGLLRGDGARDVALWAAGGFAFAAALFLASGLLFPDVSHGSQVAGSGEGLYEILVRKLAISLGYLLNPVLLLLLATGAATIYAGWRRARGTPLAAGIPGALVAAAASGALNDSGLIATLFALIYPFVAALGILISKDNAGPRRSS